MTQPLSKIAKIMKVIGTHNGKFHCDEVLACWMLKRLPEYRDAEITRTRDPKLLDKCDIVVDVGGVYSHSLKRYDHHQETFELSFHDIDPEKRWVTRLSSAGLVYIHYGKRVLTELVGNMNLTCNNEQMNILYDKIYEELIEEVDAVDNGINPIDGETRYQVTTQLGERVARLNPAWNDPDQNEDARFEKAMVIVGEELSGRVSYMLKSWFAAYDIVNEAIGKRFEVDKSGEIITFPKSGCPWTDHLFNLEKKLKIEGVIKYVVYPDQNKNWRIQCVPGAFKFENRLTMTKEWCGKRDEELSAASGIPDCVFIHKNGFIGANKTYEGVIAMGRAFLTNKQ